MPDEIEGTKPEGEKTDEEKKAEEAKAAEEVKTKAADWDKERQRADQTDANLRKVMGERDAVKDTLAEQAAKIEDLETKVKVEEGANDVKFDDLDPETAEIGDVIKQNKKLIGIAAEDRKARIEQHAEIERLKGDVAERAKVEADQKTREAILAPLDEEYGAKHRNKAIALAEKVISDRGYKPESDVEAYRILQTAYRDVSGAETKTTTPEKEKEPHGVAGDTGGGGTQTYKDASTGTIEEIEASMMKDGKLTGITLPTAD